jgi:hypothetical protein
MADAEQSDLNWAHPANAHIEIEDAARGILKCVPPRPNVAIIGFASSTRLEVPFDDPTYEVWGLNQLYRFLPRADRWWEIHYREMFTADIVRDTDYVGWLQRCKIPIVMKECQPDMPMSVAYPMDAILQGIGARKYFTSTPSYMMAMAIAEGFEKIMIRGIDLVVGVEYQEQKPCMEYWIAFAEARGIVVDIHPDSALCKSSHLYGFEPKPSGGHIHPEIMKEREGSLLKRRDVLVTELNAIDGAIQENQYWQQVYDLKGKGARTS